MAEGWIDHERTFSGTRAGGPGSRATTLEAVPSEDASTFSVMRLIEETIPKGRLPYVRARLALAEIALAKENSNPDVAVRHLIEAAVADRDNSFEPPLSTELSLALQTAAQAYEPIASWRWHRRSSRYPYAADEYGDVIEQYEAVQLLFAAIVDHGSTVHDSSRREQ